MHCARASIFHVHCGDAGACSVWQGARGPLHAQESGQVRLLPYSALLVVVSGLQRVSGQEFREVCLLMPCRYKDEATEGHQVVQWLWQTLESFSNDERILFLRFVSGRSRLPVRISDIPQRFRISVYGQVRPWAKCIPPTRMACGVWLEVYKWPVV